MFKITCKRIYHSVFIMVWSVVTGFAQVTTIVNYDFNSGSSFGTLAPSLAPGITCATGSTETFSVSSGTAAGVNAFTASSTAGNALTMANSSGTNTRYFMFQLGGTSLALHHTYKIYFQAQRASAGASTITLAYSTNGVNYSNLSTTQTSGNGSFSECSYDLSAVSSINLKSAVYFKLMVSGASGTGSMAIDNFQVRATKCTTPAPAIGTGAVPTASLLAYWPFDGNANDLSGNGNNGSVTSASLAADRFGNPNKAYYFNGTTSRIDVPHSSTVDMASGNDYTMAFWLKTKPGNVFTLPISKAPLGAGVNGYHFFVNNTDAGYCNGTGKFTYYVAAGANGDACADNLISNDTANWYFITGQYKHSTNQTFLYVNGVLQSDVGSASGILSNTAPLSFGACGCGAYQFYHGYLDDIRFYKGLLTPTEINTLYNEPNPLGILSCSSPSLTLNAYTPVSGATYSWSPGGATTPSLVVTVAGTYTLKVTDPANGCTNTATTTIREALPGLAISAVPTTSLLAYWPFDGSANDLSGNGNNGSVTSASLAADRFGNPNKAYYFNGTTSRIDVPHSSTVDMASGNDYTMAFWLKTKPGNVFTLPISKAPLGAGVNGYHFFVNNTDAGYCNGTGKFTYYVAAGANGDACADNLISNDTANWYFITGQYKHSTNQTFLYVNGVLQSDVGSASGILSNTAPLSFGACGCGAYQFYHGYLDDIRFYKRLLTQDEINKLYYEPNPVISCSTPSITLTGISPVSGVTYSWSPGGATTASLVVSTAGTYTLKATNPSNSCVSTALVSVAEIPCLPYYFTLKKTLDGGYYDSYKSKIYFSFEEEYYDSSQGSANSLSYTIVTDKNIPVSSAPGLIERIGDNRYSLDLSAIGGAMAPGSFYRIAITNKKNEVFYADFKY